MRKKWKLTVCSMVVILLSAGAARAAWLVPLGVPVGVRMTASGVVISSMNEVESAAGAVCPGAQAGLERGDILQTANGQDISSSDQLAQLVQQGGGEPVALTGLRGDVPIEVTVQPVQSRSDGAYQIGLLVRDSMAGIGTLTYADPQTDAFGALGHPVSDVDSGVLLPLDTGAIVPAEVVGVMAGEAGTPGELIGSYDFTTELGQLEDNTPCGIFGTLQDGALLDTSTAVETASQDEVHTGAAQMLTCVDGSEPALYDIEIEKTDWTAQDGRSLTIRVTDETLLAKTGGIVPGMSGSPILMDGKLAGAVTHVLVNDPTRGYGIFIDTMLAQ